MTRGEYICYSECRQASFTYKKLDRFRRWCEISAHKDTCAHPDVIDILGFLVYEMVSKMTKISLLIKYQWETTNRNPPNYQIFQPAEGNYPRDSLLSNMACNRTPLRPEHVHEAYRRLQHSVESPTLFRSSTTRKGPYFF